ncbi:MAG: FeoB-associated Cys-rich membrane protein [Pyrinomonadaceae bacterium]
MDLQLVIVGAIILTAIGFAVAAFVRKTRSFSTKTHCGSDCGCNGTKDKLTSSKV